MEEEFKIEARLVLEEYLYTLEYGGGITHQEYLDNWSEKLKNALFQLNMLEDEIQEMLNNGRI